MIKKLGRILVRDSAVGLYFPYPEGLQYGLHEIVEVLGEVTVKYIGTPDQDPAMIENSDPNWLMILGNVVRMTADEVDQYRLLTEKD